MNIYSKIEIVNILKKMRIYLINDSNKFFDLHSLLYKIMYEDKNGNKNYCGINSCEENLLLDFVYDLDYIDQDIFKNINSDSYRKEKEKMMIMVDDIIKKIEG